MRLALDLLISAVFAIFSAAVGFFGASYAAILAGLIFSRNLGVPGGYIFIWFLVILVGFTTIVCGLLGFPLCGIWLEQRRQRRKLQETTG